MGRTTRSRAIVVAAVFLAVLFLASGAAVWFVDWHSEAVPSSVADAEFDQIRSRFAGQSALLDMATRQVERSRTAPSSPVPLHTFHTVILDTRGGNRLVRTAVPYWLARRYARHDGEFRWLGELTFLDDTEFDPEAIRLAFSEVQRQGPGVLVDYRHPTGGQFIAWVD